MQRKGKYCVLIKQEKNKKMKKIKNLVILSFFAVLLSGSVLAQSIYDGYNLNFTNGYTGWRARTGDYSSSTSTAAVYNWTQSHNDPATATADGIPVFVINTNATETDSRTSNHPIRKIPEGYTRSSQINNYIGNHNCSELKYTLDVSSDNALLTFNYAMVLQAPDHTGYQNPTFQIDVVLLNNTNENLSELVDPCAKFEQVGDDDLVDNVTWFSDGGYEPWVWCDWQKITINLMQYEGERVTVRIRLGDCIYTAHGAYGYVVASATEPTLNVAGCAGEGNVITSATAPDGFQNYEWFRINTNSSSQTAIANDYATAVANNEILSTDQEFFITEDMMQGSTTKYFAVKLTSPRTQTSRPNCIAYIRTKVDDMRPKFESATYIPVNPRSEEDEIGFKFNQVQQRSDAFPLIWEAITFGDGDSASFVKDAGKWVVDPALPLSTNTRVVLDNSGSVDTVYHIYTPGTYDAIRYAQSSNGSTENAIYCERNKVIEVPVAERPSLLLVGADTICFGAKDTIRASSPNNAPEVVANYVYDWWYSVDDTASAPAHTGTTLFMDNVRENTTVVVRVTDTQNDFYRFGYFDVTVQAFPELTLTGDTLLCIGQNANISAADGTGNTIALQWTFNDPGNNPVITNPQTNPVLQFTPSKDTTVFLIAKTSAGCVNYDSIHIFVTNPKVSADIQKVCPGDPVVLTGDGIHTVDYSWVAEPSDASLTENVRSADPITVTPMETTIYTMSGYGESGCHADVSIQIKVIPYPEATITYSPNYVDTDEPTLSVTDASPFGATSVWTFSDGGTSTSRTLTYEFHDLTTDSVGIHLLTANELGCTDETSVNVPVELFAVWVPTAFTPNGDGSNDYFFFISNNTLEDVKFEVYNRWGTCLYKFEEKSLNISQYSQDPTFNLGWDGKYNGEYVQNGAYVWRLSYRREGATRVYDRTGSVAVVK